MFKLGLFWVSSVQYLLLVPLYIISGPICMVSSSLFDWTLKWVVDDQTFALMIVLMVEWTISVLFIAQLMMSRTGRTIIFYEFVFFIVCLNFIFIGITYTLLQRYNIIEQFTAKVCTSLMLVLIGEKLKKQYKDNQEPCSICFNSMNEECIILKCSHVFHESCLWEWVYIKQECPSCKKKI